MLAASVYALYGKQQGSYMIGAAKSFCAHEGIILASTVRHDSAN